MENARLLYGPDVVGVGVVARATGVVFAVATVVVAEVAVVVKGWCKRKGAFCRVVLGYTNFEGNCVNRSGIYTSLVRANAFTWRCAFRRRGSRRVG